MIGFPHPKQQERVMLSLKVKLCRSNMRFRYFYILHFIRGTSIMIPGVNFHELAMFLFATIIMSKNVQIHRVLIDFRFIVYNSKWYILGFMMIVLYYFILLWFIHNRLSVFKQISMNVSCCCLFCIELFKICWLIVLWLVLLDNFLINLSFPLTRQEFIRAFDKWSQKKFFVFFVSFPVNF